LLGWSDRTSGGRERAYPFVREALADGRLEAVLTDWSLPLGGLYLLTPSAGPRPARVEALVDFLVGRLRRGPEGRRMMRGRIARKCFHRGADLHQEAVVVLYIWHADQADDWSNICD